MSRRPFPCWILLSAVSLRCVLHTTVCVHMPPIFVWLIALRSPEQYLQSPLQLEHAIGMLLDSELFQFHSERMSEIIAQDSQKVTSSRAFEPFLSTHTQGRLQIRTCFTYSTKPSSVMDTAGWMVSDLINAGNPCFRS
jgi:hypothetical protein